MKWILVILAIVAAVAGWIALQGHKERFDVVRANVSGALRELSAARDAVSDEFARSKALPGPREFPASDKHVRGIKLDAQGRLVMTLSFPDVAETDGKHIVYEPVIAGSAIQWRCKSPDLEAKYLPVACR